jgi:hypothetical protein
MSLSGRSGMEHDTQLSGNGCLFTSFALYTCEKQLCRRFHRMTQNRINNWSLTNRNNWSRSTKDNFVARLLLPTHRSVSDPGSPISVCKVNNPNAIHDVTTVFAVHRLDLCCSMRSMSFVYARTKIFLSVLIGIWRCRRIFHSSCPYRHMENISERITRSGNIDWETSVCYLFASNK